MDDLSSLKGIGKATAAKLVGAGIDTFAKLAAATPEQLQAIPDLSGSPTVWLEWQAEAKAKAARPMTPEELSALAASWDNARAELKAAGDAVAALGADAPADQLATARARVATAEKSIAELTPLPEGLTLPAAQAKPAQTNTLQQEGGKTGGGPATAPTAAPALESITISGELFNTLIQLSNVLQVTPETALARVLETAADTIGAARGTDKPGNPAGPAVWASVISPIRWKGETLPVGKELVLPLDVFRSLEADGAVVEAD